MNINDDFILGYLLRTGTGNGYILVNLIADNSTDDMTNLYWTNPSDTHWIKTIIIRKKTSRVTSITDGTKIFETTDRNINSYSDPFDNTIADIYYYRAFAILELTENEEVVTT